MISYRTTTKSKLTTHQKRQLMSLSWRGFDYIRKDYLVYREDKDKILLALDNGRIVGWGFLRENRTTTTFYVFINIRHRNRGLGRGLFRLACRRVNTKTIKVFPHHPASRAFYRKMEAVAKEFKKRVFKFYCPST